MIDEQTYRTERAICDKAARYARRTMKRNKGNFLTAEQAAHPDYAACDNAMRGRVEQFEIFRDKPARLVAYLSSDVRRVTVWTGDELGAVRMGAPYRSNMGDKRYPFRVNIAGAEYAGIGYGGGGMYARLRRLAA